MSINNYIFPKHEKNILQKIKIKAEYAPDKRYKYLYSADFSIVYDVRKGIFVNMLTCAEILDFNICVNKILFYAITCFFHIILNFENYMQKYISICIYIYFFLEHVCNIFI